MSQPHQYRTSRPPQAAPAPTARGGGRSLLQIFAAVVGATFLLVGILGFIPGVTENYDDLALAGTDSNAELFGLFRVSVLHNIVHLLFGVGLLAAARPSSAAAYLIGGGVVYLVVVLYGFLIDETSDANFLPINDADNILHLVLGIGMIALGLIGTSLDKRRTAATGYGG